MTYELWRVKNQDFPLDTENFPGWWVVTLHDRIVSIVDAEPVSLDDPGTYDWTRDYKGRTLNFFLDNEEGTIAKSPCSQVKVNRPGLQGLNVYSIQGLG